MSFFRFKLNFKKYDGLMLVPYFNSELLILKWMVCSIGYVYFLKFLLKLSFTNLIDMFIYIYDILHHLWLSHLSRTYTWQGGAGTWSDGKLVTRIGRNSDTVLAVSTLPLSSWNFAIYFLLITFPSSPTLKCMHHYLNLKSYSLTQEFDYEWTTEQTNEKLMYQYMSYTFL